MHCTFSLHITLLWSLSLYMYTVRTIPKSPLLDKSLHKMISLQSPLFIVVSLEQMTSLQQVLRANFIVYDLPVYYFLQNYDLP